MLQIEELFKKLIQTNGIPNKVQSNLPSEGEINEFQECLQFLLPQWYKYYLMHNIFSECTFEYSLEDSREGFVELINFENIKDEWDFHKRAHPKFPFDVLPFTDGNGGGDYHYVTIDDDMNNVKLIEIYHDSENEWELISGNLYDFLKNKEIS